MKRFIIPGVMALALIVIYFKTLAPGLFWADSSSFAACNAILGLPHSPSFPIYTILGRFFNIILPVDPALATNIFSAVTTICASLVMYGIILHLLTPLAGQSGMKPIIAAFGTLIIFLTLPVWQSAVRAEVYALNLLFGLLVVNLFLRVKSTSDSRMKIKFSLLAVFIQGLAYTNHSLLAMMTLPFILALPFVIPRQIIKGKLTSLLLAGTLLFVIALSCYAFLPIRANEDPAINSGQPKTVADAAKVITRTGEDYFPETAYIPPDYPRRVFKLSRFILNQGGVLLLAALFWIIAGIVQKKSKHLWLIPLAILTGFGITVWAVDFDLVNFDIVAYAGLSLTLAMGLGVVGSYQILSGLVNKFNLNDKLFPVIAVAVLSFLLLSQVSENLQACDLSNSDGADRLALMMLDQAPQDAILILYEDSSLMPLWYHHLARGKRSDLAIVSGGAFYRPSYRGEVRILYPDLIYPPEFSLHKIHDMITAMKRFCSLNLKNRPILIQPGVLGVDNDNIVPHGLLFSWQENVSEAQISGSLTGAQLFDMLDRIAGQANDLMTHDIVARMAFNYGIYFDQCGRTELAFELFQYAVDSAPTNPQYLWILGKAALDAGLEKEAIMLLEAAVKTGDGCPEAQEALKNMERRKLSKI